MPKTFAEIIKEAEKKGKYSKEFIENAEQNSEYSRYEQGRKNAKQLLKDMLLVYGSYANGDSEYAQVLVQLRELSEYDVTTGWDYTGEVGSYNRLMESVLKYEQLLDQKESELHSEAEEKLKIEKNGERVWASDTEIKADGKLMKDSIDISVRQNKIDNMRKINNDILYILERESNGRLPAEPADAIKISSVGKKFDMVDYGAPAPVQPLFRMGIEVDHSDRPLFPHEPNINDIAQGLVGDCFYLTALTNIVSMNPDFIKDAMRDNMDGTVTVRLYSKDEYGKYEPVYVTVDKKVDSYGGAFSGGGENCVWVDCFERALATSGMYSFRHQRRNYWKPVPPNIETIYAELLEKKEKGELVGETLKKARSDYPWIFRNTGDGNGETDELVKWPNYNSISGGLASVAMEMLTGPAYPARDISIPKNHNSYINLNCRSAAELLYIAAVNTDGNMDSKYFHAKTDVNFGATTREIAEKAWETINARRGNKPLWFTTDKQSFVEQFETVCNSLTQQIDGEVTSEKLIAAGKKFNYIPENANQDAARNLAVQANLTAQKLGAGRYNDAQNKFYQLIKECERRNLPMDCGSDRKQNVIAGGHAYAILGAYEDNDGRRFLRLRNPWGDRPLFSNGLETTFNEDGSKKYNWTKVEDGIFDIELGDFSELTDHMAVNGYNNDTVTVPNKISNRFGSIHDRAIIRSKSEMLEMIKIHILTLTDDGKEKYTTTGTAVLKNDVKGYMLIAPLRDIICKNRKIKTDDYETRHAISAAIPSMITEFLNQADSLLDEVYGNVGNKTETEILREIFLRFNTMQMQELEAIQNRQENKPWSEAKLDLIARTIMLMGKSDSISKVNNSSGIRFENQFERLKDMIDSIEPEGRLYLGDFSGNIDVEREDEYIESLYVGENGVKYADVVKSNGEKTTVTFSSIYDRINTFTFKDMRPEVSKGLIAPGSKIDVAPNAGGKAVPEIPEVIEDNPEQPEAEQDNPEQPEVEQGLPPAPLTVDINDNAAPVITELNTHASPSNAKNIVSVASFRDYLKLLNDIAEVLDGTDSRLVNSSGAFRALSDGISDARREMVMVSGRSFTDLADVLTKLEPLLDDYDRNCRDFPHNNWRRNTRVQACELLRETIRSAKVSNPEPCRRIEEDYSKKMAEHLLADSGERPDRERINQVAEKLLDNKQFKGHVTGKNLFLLSRASAKEVKSNVKTLQKEGKKHLEKNSAAAEQHRDRTIAGAVK